MKHLIAAFLLAMAMPAAACAVTEVPLTLEPGWEHYEYFHPPVARKDCMGIVRVEGGLRYTGPQPPLSYTSSPVTQKEVLVMIYPPAFTLPPGYRPAHYEIFPMSTVLIPGEIHVTPQGTVVVVGEYAPVLTIFSGVSYRAP